MVGATGQGEAVLKVEIGACLDVEMAPVVALMPWVQTWAPARGAATGPEVAAEAAAGNRRGILCPSQQAAT